MCKPQNGWLILKRGSLPPQLGSISNKRPLTAMVTLITEKLRSQTLDDSACKTFSINLTLKNAKSLSSLDYDDEDYDETQMKTIVSSPCDSNDLNIITPDSSLERARLNDVWPHDARQPSFRARAPKEAAALYESGEETSDCESGEGGGIFPLDCEGLDLEQIENN